MISLLRHKTRTFWKNRDGATAVEAAIVFPILIASLFAVLGMGSFMYGSHQAQRVVEETAREVRMVHAPDKAAIETVLAANMKKAPFGTYTSTVTMLSQHGGSYADIEIAYSFRFALPVLDKIVMTSDAKTQVKIRDMPA